MVVQRVYSKAGQREPWRADLSAGRKAPLSADQKEPSKVDW